MAMLNNQRVINKWRTFQVRLRQLRAELPLKCRRGLESGPWSRRRPVEWFWDGLHPRKNSEKLGEFSGFSVGVSENVVKTPLYPMVLLIIIPIKWLFVWEYTLFSDKPVWKLMVLYQVISLLDWVLTVSRQCVFVWRIAKIGHVSDTS